MSAQLDLIRDIKQFLKSSPTVKGMFDKFSVDLKEIDSIPVHFAALPVSAKTKNCEIFINKDFLTGGDFVEHLHYIVHETCHYLQQKTDNVIRAASVDYLDCPSELEAFMYQVSFMKEFYDDDFAQRYIEDLLDFHEYTGQERKKKRKLILGD